MVRRLSSRAGELVVKSPHSNPLLAWFGRRAIRREALVYARLQGVDGVPRSFGLAAGEHLVLEHIDGPTLRESGAGLADRERFFDRLLATLRAMHAAGVAHGDLKRKENLLVGPDESPRLIDFGIAAVDQDGALARLRFDWTRQVDLNAYIKLKYGPDRSAMTAQDAALYRPLWIERVLRKARRPWQWLTLRRARKTRRGGWR